MSQRFLSRVVFVYRRATLAALAFLYPTLQMRFKGKILITNDTNDFFLKLEVGGFVKEKEKEIP